MNIVHSLKRGELTRCYVLRAFNDGALSPDFAIGRGETLSVSLTRPAR